ncbi:MAG TPA: tripartite tricarboxylate transporter substrate-binding protein [Candidatus Binatia bacterium]|jgi:tripartite-type tricarboxylate transporter receptor subunit TctC
MFKGLGLAIGVFLIPATLIVASSTEAQDFYQGKTIRLVVGYAPGGGYDFYARLVARYMGKHIPGNPGFVVENMPGAGSLASANYLYKLAKADGLTIGHFNGSLFPLQAMGQKEITFDANNFRFVGAVAKVEIVCGFPKAGGIDSPEKWLSAKTPPRLGGTAPGTGGHDTTRLLHATIGVPIQMVLGYKSTGDMRLAMERGELNGLCTGWESFKSLWRSQIESGEFGIVLQVLAKPHPDLPKVPLAISYAKTEEARQLLQAGAHDISAISRPLVLPPNTPKERVQILQKAFTSAMNDPGLLSDAAKANLDISPLTGEELEKTIHGLLKTPPALLAKLKQIISPQ